MWVNFKTNDKQTECGNRSRRQSALQIPYNTPQRKTKPEGIKRQSSTQSSVRSNKSSNSLNHIQKKVEEHFFQTQTSEWQKQEVYRQRRTQRKLQEKQKAHKRLRRVRKLFIPVAILILLGIVTLFGATVRSIGEGTLFWTSRDVFRIIGPLVLVMGIVLLFVTVGLENELSKGQERVEFEPFIHPDFKTHNGFSRQASQETSSVSLERGRSIYSLNDSQNRSFFLNNSHNNSEMTPMMRSVPESTVNQRMDLVSKWANAMKVPVRVDEIVTTNVQSTDICTNSDKNSCNIEYKPSHQATCNSQQTVSYSSVSPAARIEFVVNECETTKSDHTVEFR